MGDLFENNSIAVLAVVGCNMCLAIVAIVVDVVETQATFAAIGVTIRIYYKLWE